MHDALGGDARFLISGGAALPKDTAELFAGLGLPLAEGYGLTEAAPVLTVAKASVKAKPGNVGKAVPGVEIKIDKPDDSGVGEVLARGPNVMVGYAGNAEATAQAIDAEGWLHTGDLGKLDKRKRLVIVGRQKDVIVSASGENVYPDDVEDAPRQARRREGARDRRHRRRQGRRARRLPRGARGRAPPTESYDALPPLDARRAARARAGRARARRSRSCPRRAQPAVVHLWDADLPRTATRKVKRTEVKAVLATLVERDRAAARRDGDGARQRPVRHAVATIASKKAERDRAQARGSRPTSASTR